MRIAAGSERRGGHGAAAAAAAAPATMTTTMHCRSGGCQPANVEPLEARLMRYHTPPSQLDFSRPGSTNWVQDIAQTADGRDLILAGGEAVTGQFALARYVQGSDGNGVLDATFGGGTGAVVINQTSGPLPGLPDALAVLPDGRIVTAGILASFPAAMTLTRHLADGSLDPTFGTDGVQHATASGYITDLVVAPDGKLLVVGGIATGNAEAPWNGFVRRFNADGTADATFGPDGDGLITVDFAQGWMDELASAYVDDEGRVVAIGTTSQQTSVVALLRVSDAGVPDETFGPGGQRVGNADRAPALHEGFAAVAFGYRDRSADVARVYAGDGPPFMLNGYLYVAGTPDDDVIHIGRVDETTLTVNLNGVAHTVGGVILERNTIVDALGGDDLVLIDRNAGCAYVWGGDGDDSIAGSDRVDVLAGGAGHDRIDGNGGDDSIFGGSGADAITGGAGYDLLGGGNGNDRFAAGGSTDFVFGSHGDDLIGGGNGSDYLFGGAGADTLNGNGGGTDQIDAGEEPVASIQAGVYAPVHAGGAAPGVTRSKPAAARVTASAFASLHPEDDDDNDAETLISL